MTTAIISTATDTQPGPRLTGFQKRILSIVKAIGPVTCGEVAFHCTRPRRAVMKTLWRLRQVDLVVRSDKGYSVPPGTVATRHPGQPIETVPLDAEPS